ncbi:MAG: glycosyltransferase family 4 protein [Bacteroidales bacterium]|jgi:glycosyltransferase involved in cell wall biosynthesis|nr:glycosyltransferase family 4 protein [Bacteroidales bacterium]
MRKQLYFVTEARFWENEDGVFSQCGFPYLLWTRYLAVFSSVTVVARVEKISNTVDAEYKSSGPGVSFHRIPYYEGPSGFTKKRKQIRLVLKDIASEIRDSNSSVICRLPGMIGGWMADLLAKNSIEYACEVVGDPWDVYAPGAVNHPLRPIFRLVFTYKLKRQVKRAKQVLYVTENHLQKRYPALNATFVTNASNVQINDDIFKNDDSPHYLSAPYSLLSIGSLEQLYKSPDIALKAVRVLNDKGINCRLVWLGGGRMMNQMKDLASSLSISHLVDFRGNVNRGELFRCFANCDFYLQVSRAEGLPRALLEAMSQGLVCVGTRVGGIPELLSNDVIIEKGSVSALCDCIERLISTPSRCNELSSMNLNKSKEYSESVLSARRESFYKNIINQPCVSKK